MKSNHKTNSNNIKTQEKLEDYDDSFEKLNESN